VEEEEKLMASFEDAGTSREEGAAANINPVQALVIACHGQPSHRLLCNSMGMGLLFLRIYESSEECKDS